MSTRTAETATPAASGTDPMAALAPWRGRLRYVDDIAPPVVVACSGGPDSIALLALAVAAGLEPVAVHVDHGLRPDSAGEAGFVAAVAERLGARFRAERIAIEPGTNLEARAREARYRALERSRTAVAATTILVGHTADDQAETVLLNVLRGSASAGLGGMPGVRGHVARPLLGMRRADTREVCAALGVTPIADPMNDDHSFRRVQVRHEVIPVLERAAGRDLVPVLARQADVLRAESEFLDDLARAAWPASAGDASVAALTSLPMVLARRAVRCWLGPPPPALDEVDRVVAVARGDARATELRGGRTVRRSRGRLHVGR